jgi:antitoxin component of RelBE/YafQ-DinJ toxin-antitoxin module
MKTIQMTIDEKLLQEVDSLVDRLGTTRSAFIRKSLKEAIRHERMAELERKYAEEYAREPVDLEEINLWDGERAWGEEYEER